VTHSHGERDGACSPRGMWSRWAGGGGERGGSGHERDRDRLVGAIAVPPGLRLRAVLTASVQVAKSATILGMLSLDRLQVNRQPGMKRSAGSTRPSDAFRAWAVAYTLTLPRHPPSCARGGLGLIEGPAQRAGHHYPREPVLLQVVADYRRLSAALTTGRPGRGRASGPQYPGVAEDCCRVGVPIPPGWPPTVNRRCDRG
jgi:hypothetical protein